MNKIIGGLIVAVVLGTGFGRLPYDNFGAGVDVFVGAMTGYGTSR